MNTKNSIAENVENASDPIERHQYLWMELDWGFGIMAENVWHNTETNDITWGNMVFWLEDDVESWEPYYMVPGSQNLLTKRWGPTLKEQLVPVEVEE